MKLKTIFLSLTAVGLLMSSCKDDASNPTDTFDTSGQYTIADQMARPAINTVFVGSAKKNQFNSTAPSQMAAAFRTDFEAVLTGFGYTKNALGQDKSTFAGLLVTDVLNVATNKKTTFFDGTNVLTGRDLADDVIDVELLLIFGGPTGVSNPSLTKDNVNANDKPFLTTFPYMAAPF
jgi:Domain of unknown function (DUF4331)